MHKDFVICICAVALGGAGWVGSKQYEKYEAQKFAREQAAVAEAAQQKLATDKARMVHDLETKRQADLHVAVAQKSQTLAVDRKVVETELAACKLSSIMLGEPSLAIINKKGYEPGGELSLPSGKTLSVTAIRAEDVLLSDGQQSYRLALPTARDVGVSR